MGIALPTHWPSQSRAGPSHSHCKALPCRMLVGCESKKALPGFRCYEITRSLRRNTDLYQGRHVRNDTLVV